MILNIAKHKTIRGIEGGVYYFNLHDYPHISRDELKLAVAFVTYEQSNNKQTKIVCDDEQLLTTIKYAITNPETVGKIILSETTEFVYHATGLSSTRGILSSDKLLSSIKVYKKTGEELAFEKRESPWNDPADFFEYIMFCNGDDMTGDYVVLSENFPNEKDLENGSYNAGVRFYIRSDAITQHPCHVFDGYHPVKVKDEITLSDYLYACIVPEQYKTELADCILPELSSKIHYLSQRGLTLSDWNKKVYHYLTGR